MAKEWIDERTILLGWSGSYAYGTETEKSDKDFKGVCIPPVKYYFGLDNFNQYKESTADDTEKNTKDDVDVTIWGLNTFVKDCANAVPASLELLHLNKEQYQVIHPYGQLLIDNRDLFLSKQIKYKFGGFAKSQLHRMQRNAAKRSSDSDTHDYDTKFFYHAVRLLLNAIRIFETGTFETYSPDRDFLMDCRNGKYTLDEAVKMIENLDRQMAAACEQSTLPDKPDKDKINDLLVSTNFFALYYNWDKGED